MYSLVAVDPKKEYGVARLPEWKTVQDGLKRNLVAMLQHYRHASYSVVPDHLLVKFIQSINVPVSLNSERYYSNILMNALATANAVGMTTPFGTGKLFQGVFFNKNIKEVVIAFDEPFRVERVEADWQNATPVRVLRHPYSQLSLQVPNGRFQSNDSGISVIAVNVSLLMVMYRCFVMTERSKQAANPDYVQRNIMQFMHMFVLPNMLESYLDYALFNRFDEISQNVWVTRRAPNSVIHLPSYESQVASIYARTADILNRSSYTAPMTLAAVPVASVPDLRSVMFVPDVAPTRQILWSVILARLPMLLFLVRSARQGETVQNQAGLSDVKTTLRKLKSQKVLDSALPKELYQTTMDSIDEILGSL
jgi:hypothetical protein